jgi:integrase
MATIRKLKSGSWNVQVRRKGKLVASKTVGTSMLAKKWAKKKESELCRDRVFFIDAGEKYCHVVLSGKPSQKSTLQYVCRIAKHSSLQKEMYKITLQDVNEFKQVRLLEVHPTTCRDELLLIKRIFKWHIRELLAANNEFLANPCDNLSVPPPSKPRDRIISETELKLLLAVMTPMMATITELAFETAMRRSEILKLRVSDLNLSSRFLRVVDGKEGSRDVPLTNRAVRLLEATLESMEGDQLRLYPVAPFSVSQAFRRARLRLGFGDDVRFHQLRHTRISMVARKGFSQAQIMIVSGHRDIRSVQRYTHLNVRDVIGLID